MKIPKISALWRGATLQRDVVELRDLLVSYLKDETIGPFRNIGRYLAFGVLGSLFVAMGYFLLLIGLLRYLQWQFPYLDGAASWIPYAVLVLSAGLLLIITIKRIAASVGPKRIASDDTAS